MNVPRISTASSPMPRRTFLRGFGITLGLPMLECMTPVFARAAQPTTPKRMLVIANNLGVLPKNFFPATTGRDYALSPYLEMLAEVRNEFSVFSGLSHPGAKARRPPHPPHPAHAPAGTSSYPRR